MRDPARDQRLDVHLFAVDDGAARELGALDIDPEVAPLGEIEGRRGSFRAGLCCESACERGANRQNSEVPPADLVLIGSHRFKLIAETP
jgi:hypothetical protein